MKNHQELINQIKLQINTLKHWSGEKQKNYLIEFLAPFLEELKEFSFDEKKEVLHYAVGLSTKSHINILAKYFNVNLNDENLNIWTVLGDCYDNSYALNIIEKKDNWNDFQEGKYFFECVLLKGSMAYIDKKEQKYYSKMLHAINQKTDIKFWLSKEKTTGLSNVSYVATKYHHWSEISYDVLNIKPSWCKNVILNNETYSEEKISIIRQILDNYWLQKLDNENFVFEHEKIDSHFLSKMWLFHESHFKMNMFSAEEKSKFLKKLLSHEYSFSNMMKALVKTVFDECLNDSHVKWHDMNLTKKDLKKLNEMNITQSSDFMDSIITKSRLEHSISNKTHKNKIKI